MDLKKKNSLIEINSVIWLLLLTREYVEAHGNYKNKSSQLRDLKKFIDRLDNIMTDRQARYKTLRR